MLSAQIIKIDEGLDEARVLIRPDPQNSGLTTHHRYDKYPLRAP
jgi:hypothetical protein